MYSHMPVFKDRVQAGRKLGELLKDYGNTDPFILALPRGGVILAKEIASALRAHMDVVISRKIGSPDDPEYGIGAMSEDEKPLFTPVAVGSYDLEGLRIKEIIEQERLELRRRRELYRGGKDLPSLRGKTLIVVDDGIATGVTALASAKFLRTLGPRRIILAVPVGPQTFPDEIRSVFDEIICPYALSGFYGVGACYENFDQVEDREVLEILRA